MTGKQSVTALSLLVGTLLVVAGLAGVTVAGEFDYRYEADYQSTNATHFVANTTVDSAGNVTAFEDLNDSQRAAVRQAGNGSVAFSDRADVVGLPAHVDRSDGFTHYEVVATLDAGNSPVLLSGAAVGVGLLVVLYSFRLMNAETAD